MAAASSSSINSLTKGHYGSVSYAYGVQGEKNSEYEQQEFDKWVSDQSCQFGSCIVDIMTGYDVYLLIL